MNVTRTLQNQQKVEKRGAGKIWRRLGAGVATVSLASAALGQTNPPPAAVTATNGATRLPETVVTGRQDSLLGVADSAYIWY